MTTLDIPPPFDNAWFRFGLGWIIGACLGSFGTMLAYRLPRHLSIITPRSHCPSCQTPLQPRDLIPVFSWLLARGRCRYCQAPIGGQYVGIEAATSLACAVASAWMGLSPLLFLAYIVILALVVGITIKISPPVGSN